MDEIRVVYACDDQYAMLAGVSMESLLKVHAGIKVHLYILSNHLSENSQRLLKEIAKKHDCELNIIAIDNELLQKNTVKIDAQRWSLAAFARLFTPILLPDISRIIYLDCDILVRKPLTELWTWPLNGHSCAAVSEPLSPGHKGNVHMGKDSTYYNSGVMLIDLDAWRERHALDSFLTCIKCHSGYVPYVDQGVLNETLGDDIVSLPIAYNVATEYFEFSYEELSRYRMDKNVYSKEDVLQAVKDPYIVHLTSSFLTPRPWVAGSTHPWAAEWEKTRDETPWKGAAKWPDRPGKAKLSLRWIFHYTPRAFAISIARFVNSYLRPKIEARYIAY